MRKYREGGKEREKKEKQRRRKGEREKRETVKGGRRDSVRN